MFRSINSKFYLLALLLALAFASGYAILAYFQEQQETSSELARQAILLKQDISAISELFSDIRFYEKVILSTQDAEADIHFGRLTAEVNNRLGQFKTRQFDQATATSLQHIEVYMQKYSEVIGRLIQLHTHRRLQSTEMETSYRAMVSIIVSHQTTTFLAPLFNFAHFFMNYQSAPDLQKYQALHLITQSLARESAKPGSDQGPLASHLTTFAKYLEESFATEREIVRTQQEVENVNALIRSSLNQMVDTSNTRLATTLADSTAIRQRLEAMFTAAMIIGILALLSILTFISRQIILPIRSIARVMQRVSQGEITARIQVNELSRDELDQFGRSFNTMLDSIEEKNIALHEYQKKLEENIREISARESESRKLSAQLQRAEKMEAIGTLAGGVAHDLNNILSGIVSYPELLLLDMPEDSPYRSSIETIQQSGQKAAAIVQDLLTLARRGVPVMQVISLNTLVNEYLASPVHQQQLKENPAVEVTARLAPDLLNIKGSPVHLAKTVMNLITNAMESITTRGKVDVRTENRSISGTMTGYDNIRQGDYAVLIVTDTGSGIGDGDINKIFEPFFTKKRMGKSGSGLGLAVVWGTVKDHNGYIDVKSREKQGTTFTLYFPITREEEENDSTGLAVDQYHGQGETVLVVDDVESQRLIASAMLTRLGYAVTTAASGEEAVQRLARQPADILVLDMLMPPGIDGLETYRRALAINPRQRAIIATGYSETARVKSTQELGASAFIKKPYTIQQLGMAIRKGLHPHQGGKGPPPP